MISKRAKVFRILLQIFTIHLHTVNYHQMETHRMENPCLWKQLLCDIPVSIVWWSTLLCIYFWIKNNLGKRKVTNIDSSLSEIEIQFAASWADHQSILIQISSKICLQIYSDLVMYSTAFWENIGTMCLIFKEKSCVGVHALIFLQLYSKNKYRNMWEKISPKIANWRVFESVVCFVARFSDPKTYIPSTTKLQEWHIWISPKRAARRFSRSAIVLIIFS